MCKTRITGLVAMAMLGLSLAGCGNTRIQQENSQLKDQVLQLQKENGELGNRIDQGTTAQQSLTAENELLRNENNALKARRPRPKAAKRRRRGNRKTLPA